MACMVELVEKMFLVKLKHKKIGRRGRNGYGDTVQTGRELEKPKSIWSCIQWGMWRARRTSTGKSVTKGKPGKFEWGGETSDKGLEKYSLGFNLYW